VAYDEDLAERIRARVAAEDGLTEKRMFGGLAFLINGNMAVSASGQGGMLLRVDPAQTEELIKAPHVRRFEMRGREMEGWPLGKPRRRLRPLPPTQVGPAYGTTASPAGTRAWAGVA
jgi:TfoX-like protein